MRFRNLSSIAIDKALWRQLAEAMGVAGVLPGALEDNLGMYDGSTLRITIRPQRDRGADVTTVASYAYGHIAFYPCPGCTFAFLTEQYLHELFHAWLHQNEPALYRSWDHCTNADEFARAGFVSLGGSMTKDGGCGSYRLRKADRALPGFRAFAHTLTRRRGPSVRRWKAPSEAGKPEERLEGT